MLIIAALLLIPLAIRTITTWHMTRLRQRLQGADDEMRALRERYVTVREELVETRRRLRQYQVRQSFVAADVHGERQRLSALRERRAERMAA